MNESNGALVLTESSADVSDPGTVRLAVQGGTLVASTNGDPFESLGGLTPEQESKLAAFDYNDWLQEQIAVMSAAVPALTNFREIQPQVYPANTPNTDYTSVAATATAGGAITATGPEYAAFSNLKLFQTPATLPWAFAIRAVLAPSVTGTFNFAGLTDGSTGYMGVVAYETADLTHYSTYVYDGVAQMLPTEVLSDTDPHDFVMTFDGTTLSLFIDGVLAVDTTTLTSMSNAAQFLSVGNSTTGDAIGIRAAIGFVAP